MLQIKARQSASLVPTGVGGDLKNSEGKGESRIVVLVPKASCVVAVQASRLSGVPFPFSTVGFGQSASLVPTRPDRDLENRLSRALGQPFNPVAGINVVKVSRNQLRRLANYIGAPPITFGITVNGQRTGLDIGYNELISHSIIILRVEGQQIMMHGLVDGSEPREGKGESWTVVLVLKASCMVAVQASRLSGVPFPFSIVASGCLSCTSLREL
ncbi:hypothetical protein ACH5RR_036399 [Cinchona calisaya]|uniref:Uncharacterized protein n=1 Tax=Cinchona calisaya TaxID=153742 RepID=A0ABD2Y4Z8_9GENT